jgi:U4/U6.U5 tri-snRNP-associated protein 3
MARIVEQDMPLRQGSKQGSRHATPPVAFKVGRPDSRGGSRDPGGQSPAQPDAAATGASTSHKNKPKAADFIAADEMDVEEGEEDDIEVEDDAMAAMQAMMGFGGFGTTKQKKVAGNDIGGIRKEKKTEYRQYMNRVGGFNRPLSPSRET